MLKSNKQKRAVKQKNSRKGENGGRRLTKRLIKKKIDCFAALKDANEFSVMVVIQQFYVK